TSTLSMRREVRDKVTPLQRRAAEPGGVVLEGRDTGTIVCPDADVKFFLTATLESRARRRHAELAEQGVSADLDTIRDEAEGRGMQHVPPSGPVLLIANHSSVLDPPFVGGVAPRQLTFLAKAELFAVPGFGRLIHALNARPVRREGADATALRVALRALERNGALLVFPEGTRGAEGPGRA